eukprot:3036199-Pyramimonas_sp.AAC.1
MRIGPRRARTSGGYKGHACNTDSAIGAQSGTRIASVASVPSASGSRRWHPICLDCGRTWPFIIALEAASITPPEDAPSYTIPQIFYSIVLI